DQRDAVAAQDAELAQAARQRRDLTRRLAPGDRAIGAVMLGPQEGRIAAPRRLGEEHRREAGAGPIIHAIFRPSSLPGGADGRRPAWFPCGAAPYQSFSLRSY